MKKSRILFGLTIMLLAMLLVAGSFADTTYTVKPGDTLYSIARSFNTTVPAIVAANNISNPNVIYVGQVLIIPMAGGAPPPTVNLPEGFSFVHGQIVTKLYSKIQLNPRDIRHLGIRCRPFADSVSQPLGHSLTGLTGRREG